MNLIVTFHEFNSRTLQRNQVLEAMLLVLKQMQLKKEMNGF